MQPLVAKHVEFGGDSGLPPVQERQLVEATRRLIEKRMKVSGAGMATTVKVYSGNGLGLVNSFTPFGPGTAGNATVAVGDFDGDGRRDIIIGTRVGGVGTVSVFGGTINFALWPLTLISSFQPYGNGFKGDIRLAVKPADGGNPGAVQREPQRPDAGGASAPIPHAFTSLVPQFPDFL